MSKATITYCGHATVIIHTESGKCVVIDPFLEGNPLCPDSLKDHPGRVDYILLTHGHPDHASSTVALAQKYASTVAATYELAALLVEDGIPAEQVIHMNKGGSVQLPRSEGLSVTLTNAFHSSTYTMQDGSVRYAGEACGVVLGLESGRSIYHAGDTCLFSDMELIGKKFSPEVAFIPIGDCFTMGPEDAAEATRLVAPKTVIPIHHSTFPPLTGTPAQFAELVQGVDCKALAPGESFEF